MIIKLNKRQINQDHKLFNLSLEWSILSSVWWSFTIMIINVSILWE